MRKTLGRLISETRQAKGMTQLELAQKLNVTDKAVSKWERDLSCPDVNFFPQLADGQVLGAMLFTFPACHALAGSGTFAPQSCCEQILDFRMASLGGSAVIAGKHTGDIPPPPGKADSTHSRCIPPA